MAHSINKALIQLSDGDHLQEANLAEKLLIQVLTHLSHFLRIRRGSMLETLRYLLLEGFTWIDDELSDIVEFGTFILLTFLEFQVRERGELYHNT